MMYCNVNHSCGWDGDGGIKIEIEGEKRFKDPDNIQHFLLELKHLMEKKEDEMTKHYNFDQAYECIWEHERKEPKSIKQLLDHMGIEKVIFNENATIVQLTTGEKGVAVRSLDDIFDPVVGFSVAYALAEGTRGNKRQFHHFVSSMYVKQMQKQKKKGK